MEDFVTETRQKFSQQKMWVTDRPVPDQEKFSYRRAVHNFGARQTVSDSREEGELIKRISMGNSQI